MNHKHLFCTCFLAMAGCLASTEDIQAQIARDAKVEKKDVRIESYRANDEDQLAALYAIQNNPDFLRRGTPTYLEGAHLGAIQFPVGGIGSGCIQFNGKAQPRFWQIFNNMSHVRIPNTFMLMRTVQGEKVALRALQTEAVGEAQGMKALRLKNDFPYLTYEFQDNLPVDVQLQVYNPLIPTNLKDSSLPVVFYKVTIRNTADSPVEVDLLSSQQNAVGFTQIPSIRNGKSNPERWNNLMKMELVKENASEFYGGNTTKIIDNSQMKAIYMDGGFAADNEYYGQMALMLLDGDQMDGSTTLTASWKKLDKLVSQFAKKGVVKEVQTTKPSKKGQTYSGALTTKVTLNPNETKVLNLALCWYFPNGISGGKDETMNSWGNGRWIGKGNWYATQWGSMDQLMHYVADNQSRLDKEATGFHQALFDTNLPYWAVERLSSQLSVLRSRTIFHDKNNYVGLWEGCGPGDGSCAGNCNHVWHYAQAHARLFPELARQIRQQAYDTMKEGGRFAYRQPNGSNSFDGQCGEILATYREHLLSKDNAWLKRQYPKTKLAMGYVINTWDKDQDGWLQGAKHTTYDCSLSGNPSFLTSLYMAALKASVQMANLCNDGASASQWDAILNRAQKIQNERLWNGEYYTQAIDSLKPNSDYGNGCLSDQLLGQWWADQIGLGDLFPAYRIKEAFQSIFKYNFRGVLKDHRQDPREFAKPDEPGLIVCTWPYNDRPKQHIAYPDEVWTSQEYNLAANLFRRQEPVKALTLLWAGNKRYDGVLKKDYRGPWGNFGFTGNPFGDDECGQFYSRSLCNWSILLALQGFSCDAPAGKLAFHPNWQPENHTSFFSSAEGWGNYSQVVCGKKQVNQLTCKYGHLLLNEWSVPNLVGAKPCQFVVKLNRQTVKAEVKLVDNQLVVSLPQIDMKANDCLSIEMK